jgi:hypothetical protein
MGNGSTGSALGSGAFTVGSAATLGGYSSTAVTTPTVVGTASTGTGTFAINGNVTVGTGADTFSKLDLIAGGTGTMIGGVNVNGQFSGANLTLNLAAAGTSANVLELGSTSPNFSSTTLTLNQIGSGIITPGTSYTLITDTAGFNSASDGLTTTTLPNGQMMITSGLSIAGSTYFGASTGGYTGGFYSGSYLYIDSTGDDIDVEVVPEPGTWALMLGGLAMLFVIQRRRNKAI